MVLSYYCHKHLDAKEIHLTEDGFQRIKINIFKMLSTE